MNIAVFCPNWIGDAVMATPAIAALREHFRDGRLIGVVKPYAAGVLEGNPWFDRVMQTNGGPWAESIPATAWQLRRTGIDIAVLFPNSFRSAFTAWLGGCKQIVGYARGGRSWLLTDRLEPIRGFDGSFVPSPVIDAYNRLAERLTRQAPGYRMRLFTTAKDEAGADRIWERFQLGGSSRVVALNPGAAFGSSKYWPKEYFAQLARKLAADGESVLVLCGPSERDLAREIARLAATPRVFSLADEHLSLGLSKACVRRADLVVTTDSGPRHFAAAFDRPVITLFGPTHVAWTETYFAKAVHLQKKVECGPCQLRICPLDHRCMKLLEPDEVYETAQALLARYAGSGSKRRAG